MKVNRCHFPALPVSADRRVDRVRGCERQGTECSAGAATCCIEVRALDREGAVPISAGKQGMSALRLMKKGKTASTVEPSEQPAAQKGGTVTGKPTHM